MDTDALAKMVASLTENGRWRTIQATELIDTLADNFEIGNNSSQYHSWHDHLGDYEACRRCHLFDRANFVRITKGE